MTSTIKEQFPDRDLFQDAAEYIPGGVNSVLRKTVQPMTFVGAKGPYIDTQDGRRLCDYNGGLGAVILGHRNPAVNTAVRTSMDRIDLIGAGVTDLEIWAAERVVRSIPSAELVWFTNSGSEATYIAVRLARAVTGRRKLVKFQGSYHGWHDAVLMNVESAAESLGRIDPLSTGSSPCELTATTVCRYNDLADVEAALARGDIAAVIVEPVQHNIGCILPAPRFLQGIRDLTTRYGSILIFDEIITAVRHGLGGRQAVEGVMPDLTCLGKAIGNGYPVGALAGQASLMEELATAGGGVYVGGTYNGHPASMAAVLATFDQLADGEILAAMATLGDRLRDGLQGIIREHDLRGIVTGLGSVFALYFTDSAPTCYEDLVYNNAGLSTTFRCELLRSGDLMHPLPLKRGSISGSHRASDIDRFLDHCDTVIRALRPG